MLIGLLSDTHVRLPGTRVELSTLTTEELPIQIRDAFSGVDLILHAGDIYSLPVLDKLETVAPVLAAEGPPLRRVAHRARPCRPSLLSPACA